MNDYAHIQDGRHAAKVRRGYAISTRPSVYAEIYALMPRPTLWKRLVGWLSR